MTLGTISKAGQPAGVIDIEAIMAMIPHRFPMLMVDRVIDVVPFESATGIKNITVNEPFFQGHFPGRPLMPGVMIIEAMAQTAGVLVVHSLGLKARDKMVYFLSIEDSRFRKPLLPGDQVRLCVNKIHQRGPVWKFHGEARVGETLHAEGTFTAMIADP